MGEEHATSASVVAARRRSPSALQLLGRWLLSLWWTFILALGASALAQALGARSGSLLVVSFPQVIVYLQHAPSWIQLGTPLATLAILIAAGTLTWLAFENRAVQTVEEAQAVTADQKEAFGLVMDERRIVPRLTELSEQSLQISEQAGEISAAVAATDANVGVAVAVATETRDIAERIEERQNQPASLVAGVTLASVRDLRRETFKLGDDTAANFPYVREPVTTAFGATAKALRDAAARGGGKRGVLILGEANAGKTRLALEALRETLSDWELLRWSEARQTSDFPPTEAFSGRSVVLFVDDAQEYAISTSEGPEGRIQQAIGAGATLRALWELAQSAASRVLLVATCRSSEVQRLRGSIGWLFAELALIEMPSFNRDADDPAAAHIIELFEQSGAGHEAQWDGTLGSLVLGLERKRDEFDALARAHSPAVPVLHAMKLLTLAGIFEHTETRLRHICAEILGEPRLLDTEGLWQEAVEALTGRQFVTEALSSNGQMALVIRKDTYFDDVVGDYPDTQRPLHFQQQRLALMPLFIKLADDEALFNLGNGWFDTENYNEAIRAYDGCMAVGTTAEEILFNKGTALLALKLYEEALSVFEEALLIEPQHADTWDSKGDALVFLKRYEEALPAYEEALHLEPQHAQWWADKGWALHSLNRYEEALAAFEEALRLDPRWGILWDSKGDALFNLDRFDEALAAYEEAVRLAPQRAQWLADKGNALDALGRREDAIAAYDQSLSLDPSLVITWRNKAQVLIDDLHRYQEGLEACDRALGLESGSARAWCLKGDALAGLARDDEAQVMYEHAVNLPATEPFTYFWRGRSLRSLGRYEEALADLEHSYSHNSSDAASWFEKGRVLTALRRYDEAVQSFDESLAIDADADTYDEKAKALRALGREDEARQAEERAQALREK